MKKTWQMVAVGLTIGIFAVAQSTAPKPTLERVWGGNANDTMNGMVLDSVGNAITAGISRSFVDSFYGDVLISKVSPSGELLWAKNIGTKGSDSPLRCLDGDYGSSSRSIAIDREDSIYAVSESAWAGNAEPQSQVVMKLSRNGDLLWSKAWRPHWRNQMNGATTASSVTVVGNRVFVAGGGGDSGPEAQIMVSILDAVSGNLLDNLSIDPTPGSNDRAFSIVANPTGSLVYLGGWNGRTARGQIIRFSVASDKLNLDWVREVPQETRGSTICDMDMDAAGNIYGASDVKGTQTYLELFKFDPNGKVIWGKSYNAGTRNDRSNTRVLRVIGNAVYLGGRVGYQENTQADSFFGDSVVLRYSLDGKLEQEMYHFTGTNSQVVAMDHTMGIGVFQGRLYVAGWIFPGAANLVGEWRNPNDYKFPHPDTSLSLQTSDPLPVVKTLRISAPQKNGDEIGLKMTDVTAKIEIGTPKTQSDKGRSTQHYLFTFDLPK